MRRWYWYRGRLYRRRWCVCGHEDLIHMGLTGRCLHPVEPHPDLCSCPGFRSSAPARHRH